VLSGAGVGAGAAIENAKVTGTVSEKDGVRWLAATQLEIPSQ